MIQFLNVSLAFGGQQVLNDLNWTIKPKKRIGLIGANGSGKSTLLRLAVGLHDPDNGTVIKSGDTTIGYLEQEVQDIQTDASVLEEAESAFEDVLSLEAKIERIARKMEEETDHDSETYRRLLDALEGAQARLAVHEAHRIQDKAETVLTGLGFEPDSLSRSLNTFSGGWRMRVALAKILLREPDFLLLDEPTNHLDIESIDWLENYLKTYQGTVVIVSHDRYFLDRMVTTTAELANGTITEYAGNYTFYLKEREQRRALQRASYENQQREIAQMERFIERFRYKATKARQAQSRIKMLERMERIPPPPSDDLHIDFRFPEPVKSGRIVLELSVFSKSYETPDSVISVFDKAGPLTIERGDKIALIGKNGAGKSTLARILNNDEPFDGTRTLGYHVDLSFFAQHQAEALHHGQTIMEALREQAAGKGDADIRSLLGAFLFSGDDVFKPLGVLSGGEKSRVALARTLLTPANFLVLDEPTNHLDIQSTQVLIEALRQYSGTFIIVSHDRHFLDQIVNKVWYLEKERVHTFLGNYSSYQWQIQYGSRQFIQDDGQSEISNKARLEKQPAPGRSGGPKTRDQKRREAEERDRLHRAQQSGIAIDFGLLNLFQLQKAFEKAEADILDREKRQAEIEDTLGDPTLYEDPDRSKKILHDYENITLELEDLYETWDTLADHLAHNKGQ